MAERVAEIDRPLQEELRKKRTARIIIEFFETPNEQQIQHLKDTGIKIDNVFKVSPLASGSANSEKIQKIRRLPYIKKIWLDSPTRIC